MVCITKINLGTSAIIGRKVQVRRLEVKVNQPISTHDQISADSGESSHYLGNWENWPASVPNLKDMA